MKKFLTLGAIFLAANSFSQVDFESHLMAPESYDNGSAGGGDFNMSYLTLSNVYDVTWGSWTGFAVSNVTDNTTPGYMNQYAAYPGIGNASSESYGVYYYDGAILANSGGIIDGFSITNTTYAALSMKDGDGYAKQFGSIYAGDGVTVDGTNGEDFFRVWIIAENFDQSAKDSMVFYLADYRFSDDNDDYIIDTWEYVDLTNLSVAPSSLTFRFESSDMGQLGVNTPTYFAIDDINYEMPVGLVENDTDAIHIYPNPAEDVIFISGARGNATIVDLNGKILVESVYAEGESIDVSDLIYGMYLIKVSNEQGITSSKKLMIH